MFTGLIQETGEIAAVRQIKGKKGSLTRITVRARKIPSELKLGDSVAVNGVCLTAVERSRKDFSADLAEETLQRTSLGGLKKGSCVNLELPARPADRLGGHIVQGHVDGVGKLLSFERIQGADDWRLVIEVPAALSRYIVAQGSITVEGISLTIARLEGTRVEIAIIPHTFANTNLSRLKAGSAVNVEVDVVAKYVERLTQPRTNTLTREELMRRGF
ncbi:MAG TPA: riboflavin synthase [Candidatus Angelobacter sp.]|jgi:riboflavin synthase|nr:riboflavin synthase [Candidatus Angelobacter sp.]